MSEVAVIGRQVDVGGFALAGAHVYPASSADEVRAAWRSLPPSIGFVLLTAQAAAALDDETRRAAVPLIAVLPARSPRTATPGQEPG
jgi:vacuolar-type H+-ATPase subunit F/Vma7